MDPNPKTFPILSYVMSKLPSIGPKRAAHSFEFDIEQPPPPSSTSHAPSLELSEQMPHLTDPKVIAAMRLAVAEVAQTRSVLQALGERPDHESVDAAKAKLADIHAPPEIEDERRIYEAVIRLDEMHEEYEKLLKDAEEKLGKIYESAVAGGGAEAAEAEAEDFPVTEELDEEVVRVLNEASAKGMQRIDLSGRKLRFLPEAIGRIQHLVVLNLSSNQFKVIPDSIAGLENLEELNLSANLLESLPDSIGFLFKLKVLDVSGNKLTALPDSISHCRSLVELDASFNRLTYLPTNIGYELVNLKKLSIHLNKIRSLPTSICEMRSLLFLDAHFNELRGLPLAIGRLTNLEVLNLSSNFSDLTELPDTFCDLTNLKELDLSNNQIHALPNTFGQLNCLTKLNLDQNPIVIPPEEVVNEGVGAVKLFMAKRWLEILAEEEQKRLLESKEQTETGLLTRSTSWLSNFVSGVSGTVSGYLGAGAKSTGDPYLDRQL